MDRAKQARQSDNAIGRLDTLPDNIIIHILSLLPTKDAFKTCLLSKSWVERYTMVPKLEFTASGLSPNKLSSFTEFVHRAFLLNKCPVLESFRINLGNSWNFSSAIGKWTLDALGRGVKEIDITSISTMPGCLFRANTLVFMRLEFCMLNVPSSAHLPCLKILHLIHTKYSNIESFARLIAGCSVLEELLVQRQWDLRFSFVISSRTLKRLDFYCSDSKVDMTVAENYYTSTIQLEAPCLKYLVLTDWRTLLLPNCNVGELLEARINASYCNLNTYLQHLHKCQRLWLNVLDITYRNKCPSWCGIPPRALDCLVHLKISGGLCHRKMLLKLLHRFPKVQDLELELKKGNPSEDLSFSDLLAQERRTAPQSLPSYLKRIRFRSFSGTRYECILVDYFLNAVSTLETVTIETGSSNPAVQLKIAKELLAFTRQSSVCKILFPSKEY